MVYGVAANIQPLSAYVIWIHLTDGPSSCFSMFQWLESKALSESATRGSSQQISKSKRTAVPHQRVRTRTAMAVVVGNNDMAWNALRSATTTRIGTPLHGMTLLFWQRSHRSVANITGPSLRMWKPRVIALSHSTTTRMLVLQTMASGRSKLPLKSHLLNALEESAAGTTTTGTWGMVSLTTTCGRFPSSWQVVWCCEFATTSLPRTSTTALWRIQLKRVLSCQVPVDKRSENIGSKHVWHICIHMYTLSLYIYICIYIYMYIYIYI